ncbi:uncharacterized protein BCR38DRAFT_54806 [Pseudomassariella vexata]|uniref:Uncharacterized protein n=1 Tax=Pseudomassariella vexata TaxID=1141098 RepID=A0A1Y2DLK8_9PEZI|nr:uncharacterized protein BCR38DRAFT_54806 [Pseudomassariella vexata]ORY60142.1 hypothetical protein BCR38DRAFT_54806 [Pseudomassariella vexata]
MHTQRTCLHTILQYPIHYLPYPLSPAMSCLPQRTQSPFPKQPHDPFQQDRARKALIEASLFDPKIGYHVVFPCRMLRKPACYTTRPR